MDEVSLYNRALTVEEILAIYNAGSNGKSKYQFSITTASLPTMFVGSRASSPIQTLNGTLPIVFSQPAENPGNLPPGTALSQDGVVSGTPISAGSFTFTVQAIDATGASTNRTLTASVLTALTPPSGLVDWWPADSGANDIVGINHGTFQNGATYSSGGKVAGAFSFDGVDDYVQLPNMNIGSLFSIEFWMYPVGAQNYGTLVRNPTSGSNFGTLSVGAYNNVVYSLSGISAISSASNSVPLNAWSHLTLTYDGSVARLYVNGVLQATTVQHTVTFNNALTLGGGYYYFKGLMDEVSLYNRALTVDEILAIYNAGSNGKSKYQFSITTASLPTMFVGSHVSFQIQTLNGASPISFSQPQGENNLAPGTGLGQDGVISGTPNTAGVFTFTIQAVDQFGASASRLLSANVLAALTPPSGLVDWWPGDRDVNGNASDIVGNNPGIFQNGASYSSGGKVGDTLSFDGTNDYVQLPSINVGSLFSIEFWMYPVGAQNSGTLVRNPTSGSNFGTLSVGAYNNVVYSVSGISAISSASNSVPVNTWSHVALTYDGSVARLYVNGVLQATTVQHTVTFNNALTLGGGYYYFKGLLDEVSLYNRALTADEILAIYNAGSNGKCKP